MGNFVVVRPFIYVLGAVIDPAQNNPNENTIYGGHNASMNGTTGHGHTGATGDGPLLGSGSLNLTAINQDVHLLTGHFFISDDFIPGSVLFVGASKEIAQDNPNFFWDDASDLLGIGTNIPFNPIDIRSDTEEQLTVNAKSPSTDAGIGINTNNTGNRLAYLNFVADDTHIEYAFRLFRNNTGANANSIITHRGTGDLKLTTENAGAISLSTTALERMRITSAGNVGIGTAAPATLLQVNGGNLTVTSGSIGVGTTAPTSPLHVIGDIKATNNITNGGFDFTLGNTDQASRGNSGLSRALVKDTGTTLHLNYANDFTGGTRINGNTAFFATNGGMLLPNIDPPAANFANRNSFVKAWGFFNFTGAPIDTYNISTTTRVSQGLYNVVFNTDFATSNWSGACSAVATLDGDSASFISGGSGSCRIITYNASGVLVDNAVKFLVIGDQ